MIYYTRDDCGDLREKRGNCKECHGMPHHIITMTGGATGRVLTHDSILYTFFHRRPIQNFDSIRVTASRITIYMMAPKEGCLCRENEF